MAGKANVGLSSEVGQEISSQEVLLSQGQLLSLAWGYLVLLQFFPRQYSPKLIWTLQCYLCPCWTTLSLVNSVQAGSLIARIWKMIRWAGLSVLWASRIFCSSLCDGQPETFCWEQMNTSFLADIISRDRPMWQNRRQYSARWGKAQNSYRWGQRHLWHCHL